MSSSGLDMTEQQHSQNSPSQMKKTVTTNTYYLEFYKHLYQYLATHE